MACALAKKSSASLDMAGLAVEVDAAAAAAAAALDVTVVVEPDFGVDFEDAATDAMGRARMPGRAAGREEDAASSFAEVAGSSMLAGVAGPERGRSWGPA